MEKISFNKLEIGVECLKKQNLRTLAIPNFEIDIPLKYLFTIRYRPKQTLPNQIAHLFKHLTLPNSF